MSDILCLRRVDQFSLTAQQMEQKHPDWKRTVCSVCGDECYITPNDKRRLAEEPGARLACARCAIKERSLEDV